MTRNFADFIITCKCLLASQRGAMFGMDARVALIIASVLAAAGGVTMMSKLERSRVEGAERGIFILAEAIETHYQAEGHNTLVADIPTLFTKGYVEETTLLTDPWGNNWHYAFISRPMKIQDVPVTVMLATIHSSGKDGMNDSVNITTPAEWDTWEVGNDDVGVKISTIEIEKARAEEHRKRGKQIIDRLQSYESSRYLEADSACPGGDVCTSGGKTYTQFNFYPKSNLDTSGAVYFSADVTGQGGVYVSGDEISMRKLMADIGLPADYAVDPWRRVLQYDSNATRRALPPFSASVWYQ